MVLQPAPTPPAGRASQRRIALVVACALVLVSASAAAVLFSGPWRSPDAQAKRLPRAVIVPTTTLPTIPARIGLQSSAIYLENLRPGTADWQLSAETPGAIEGYANVVSAQRGELVRLAVSTVDPTFHVEAYRMGWYQGLGGRLVWRSPELPGVQQPEAVSDPTTHLDEARWQPSVTVPVDETWLPGDYLFKLVGASNNQQLVPLTIRDDANPSTFLVVNAVTTWQAYNEWGGCSLYRCQGGGTRAKVVSFDRPYGFTEGSADFLGNEFPLVRRMEQWGYDVAYTTDVDVHRHPELLLQHKAVLTMGHDEYWSKAMRDGMEAARDQGVNLAFFGANAAFRQIRLEPADSGPERHEVNYRSTADPLTSVDKSQATVGWREPPVNRPENTLIGQQYECNPVAADLVVGDPSAWVYAGTGVTEGEHLDTVVGSEYDRWSRAPGVPENVQILAHSPVRCQGRSSYADVTYYTAPSGAGVFATGTNYWVSKHDPPGNGSAYNPVIIAITHNVLEVFGAGPAGATHPSVANASDIAGSGGRGNSQTNNSSSQTSSGEPTG